MDKNQQIDKLGHKFLGRWIGDKPSFPTPYHQDQFEKAVAELETEMEKGQKK
ncbi:hypothetical protein [Brucella anthropi]|uniref:hypothetical protein n=1 Tax=Brucella anthropi TaxID=529 RepID=UPI002165DFEA|nr:hypothetical protein [Brucella anthropi]UVV66729.1 hypothetical protein NW321_09595 [Brucella anthropi]